MYKGYKSSAVLILIPLVLSAFTHLFNPGGFPCVNFDEAVGMRRAMHFLVGLGPQDPSSRFDHSQASVAATIILISDKYFWLESSKLSVIHLP